MEIILKKSYKGKSPGTKMEVTEKEYSILFTLKAAEKVETKELKKVEQRETKHQVTPNPRPKPKPRTKRKLTNE